MILRFVSGKGGVGKTIIASALAETYSKSHKTLVVSLDQPELMAKYLDCPIAQNEPFEIEQNLWILNLDKDKCLNDFIRKFLKVGIVRKWIFEHPLYPFISASAPGLKEFLVLDRLVGFVYKSHTTKWDNIIIDTPATGHLLNLLSITRGLKSALRFGPLRQNILKIEETLRNRDITQFILVTIPDYAPIEETFDMYTFIHNELQMHVGSIILNMFPYKPPQLSLQTTTNELHPSILKFFSKHFDHKTIKAIVSYLSDDYQHYSFAETMKQILLKKISNISFYEVPKFDMETEYLLTKQIANHLMKKIEADECH